MNRPAVFLDRDGVVIENRTDYVKSWDEVRFIPGIFDAVRTLTGTSYSVVMVTNQSAVGRGIMSLEAAHAINRQVVAEIEAHGGMVHGVYLCPHRPDDGCGCRKPAPGMLLRAARELGLDLRQSFVVGDAATDIAAAQAVEAQGVLVLTGRGYAQAREIAATVPTASDLAAAVRHILAQRGMPT